MKKLIKGGAIFISCLMRITYGEQKVEPNGSTHGMTYKYCQRIWGSKVKDALMK